MSGVLFDVTIAKDIMASQSGHGCHMGNRFRSSQVFLLGLFGLGAAH